MSEKNKHEVNLKLTERQAVIVENALDFYMRWCIGQMHRIPNVLEDRLLRDSKFETREELENALNKVKKILFPEHVRNSSYGVGWNEKLEQQHAQIAYEIETSIKAFFGRSRYAEPLHYSTEELPEISKI